MKQRLLANRALALVLCVCVMVTVASCAPQPIMPSPTPVTHASFATATAIGRIVLGYGDHSPVPNLPLWLGKESIGEPVTRTNADGEFTITGLPVGQVIDVVDDHLFFQINVTSGGTIDLGTLEYPLIHPENTTEIPRQPATSLLPPTFASSLIMTPFVQPTRNYITESDVPAFPTPLPQQADSGIWMDVPMYSLSSAIINPPSYLFQVRFDTSHWQLVLHRENNWSPYSLEHRWIPRCTIERTGGIDFGSDWIVEKGSQNLGSVHYEVAYARQENELKFVNYCANVGKSSYTCFGITIEAEGQQCISDGGKVLETLQAIDNPYWASP